MHPVDGVQLQKIENIKSKCKYLLSSTNGDIKRGKTKIDIGTKGITPWDGNIRRPTNWKIQVPGENKKYKFPKVGLLHQKEAKAWAFHFFANHELLAMEAFAWAILKFADRKDLGPQVFLWYQTLLEEQEHFNLYGEHLESFGYEFGFLPLNEYFLKKLTPLNCPYEFLSVMNLTFEGANLDHALYYKEIFQQMGDDVSACLLQEVLEDEIIHIKRGLPLLKARSQEENCSLWEYYQKTLSQTELTPARAKGIIFNDRDRKSAGLEEDFILSLKNYKDDFAITQRKQWKSP